MHGYSVTRMKHTVSIMIVFFCLGCSETTQPGTAGSPGMEKNEIVAHSYSDTTIPQFFKSYIGNHLAQFRRLDGSKYSAFCATYNLNTTDSQNARLFFTVEIIHRLLTSKTAANGSVGDIISIPYYWHWVNPNPRYDIYQVDNNSRLITLPTLRMYPKYGSFADIDRTPYLFISDLFGDYPKYRSSLCDSFSTFGWCSEREMAFVTIMEMTGIRGKVIAEGNHSWSILKIPMSDNANKVRLFKVKVDNTFDQVSWNELTKEDLVRWDTYYGNVPLSGWYNAQAHSQKENARLASVRLSPSAIKHIEDATIKYLQRHLVR